MTLSLSLPDETVERLERKAAASGEDLAAYATRVLHRAASAPSIDEVLAPFRKQIADSGMSDAELDDFYSDLVDKVRQERRAAGQ